jgi:hypothetical protein
VNQRGTPLEPRDYLALAGRWIEGELADAALLRRVDDREGGEVLARNSTASYSGILIPYFLPGGEHPITYRIRRDHPEMEGGKPKGKYMAPPGENRIYFPRGIDPAWLDDTSIPVVITEGEFKTLALLRLARHQLSDAAELPRFLPVGLGGVWNWKGKVGKTEDASGTRVDDKGPIADLSLITWKSRPVVIVFDADLERNDSVGAARALLTRELKSRGAKMRWFTWPKNLPAGVKGVDDYLAVVGAEPVLRLIKNAREQAKERNWKPAHEPPQILNVASLLALDVPAPEMLIEGLLPARGACLLVGKPKSGKTLLGIQMAIAVASGSAMFRNYRVLGKGPALVLEQDDPAGAASVQGILKVSAVPVAGIPFNLAPRVPFTFGPELLQWLEGQISALELRLVLLDSYTALRAARGAGSDIVKVEQTELTLLDDLAKQTGCTILVVHHGSKGSAAMDWTEQAAGTYAMGAAVESQVHITRFKDLSGTAPERLVRVRGRHLDGVEMVLRFVQQC